MINKNLLPLYLIGLYPAALIIGTLISEIITVILAILFISECIKNKKFLFFKDPMIYFLLIIWGYLLINLFNSIDFQLSLNRSIFFIRFIFIILSIAYFLNRYSKNIDIVFKLWMTIILITIIDLYVQFFFGQNLLGFKSPWNARLSGFFDQELKVAHLLIGFFLPSFAYFFQKNVKNFYLFFFLILYFLILILTNERANIIRGTFALLIFFVFLPILKIKFKLIFSSLLILVFSSTLFLVKPVKARFINEIAEMQVNNSIKNYVIFSNYGPHYLSSIEIFKKNILFGTGIKTFRTACKNVSLEKYYDSDDKRSKVGCSTHPHQYYFEILSALGLIGFILFISFFFYLIYRIINSFFSSKNFILLSSGTFFVLQLIPLLPTGSFFTSFGATIFFINIGLIYTYIHR
tara:strand:- start:13057 stop:14274 length:1218 start_codon:yes stop_codon:yes gene_type:complete